MVTFITPREAIAAPLRQVVWHVYLSELVYVLVGDAYDAPDRYEMSQAAVDNPQFDLVMSEAIEIAQHCVRLRIPARMGCHYDMATYPPSDTVH